MYLLLQSNCIKAQRSPIRIENGNLSISENIVMTSAHARTPDCRTECGSRGKDTQYRVIVTVFVSF